jgi:hypothetical protein
MHSHNTPPDEKVKPLSEILTIYTEAAQLLSELLAKDSLTYIQSRCFVRTFSDLGECLTFFREGNPHLDELKTLTFTNVGGQQQELLSGFTGFRNKLLHAYVYEHLLNYEVKFEAAVNFARENLERFNVAFMEVTQKIQSTNSSAVGTGAVATSSGKEEASLLSAATTSASSASPASEATVSKKINKANTKPSEYSILDQAYFAKQEVRDLEKLLTESGLDPQLMITPQLLEGAMSANPYLKAALENKIENLCVILKDYNNMYTRKQGITSSIQKYLYTHIECKLSYDADAYLLAAARNRISIAHREDTGDESNLPSRINYAIEIKNTYLEKTISYLQQNTKLEFNLYIIQYEKVKLSPAPTVSSSSSAIASPDFSGDPVLSKTSTVSDSQERSTSSKRASLKGEESLHELVLSQQAKKAKTVSEIEPSGYHNETASAAISASSQELSGSDTVSSSSTPHVDSAVTSASKLQKIPQPSESEKNLASNPAAKNTDDAPTNPPGLKR